MEIFIREKMDNIFNDFKSELNNLDNYCILKDVRFNRNNVPDYTNPIIQQLYLLRYFPAYLAEYYIIYKELLIQKHVGKPFNVLSIGAGCGLDYYGLNLALKDFNINLSDSVYYTGVDLVEWKYRDDLGNTDCWFFEDNIANWDELEQDDYNIIIFPKSIGEFDNYSFQQIENIFSNTMFKSDSLCIISSLRESRSFIDGERLSRLIDILETEHSYISLDPKEKCKVFTEKKGLISVIPGFKYPDHILEFITSLSTKCGTFIDWSENCQRDCTYLNKYPILTTGHIKYQSIRLERQN